MHSARLAFLAGKHSPQRKIVSKKRSQALGWAWLLDLECGHEGNCAAHFDCEKQETWSCRVCGEEYVKTAPQYQKEFK